MSELHTIKIPDIGDVDDVEVIEVLVSVGDKIIEETCGVRIAIFH
jgi:pyruvate/2-oxoglutarate dehydrogenase complex dihydrolipoamide acyltransferase (E2) component